MCGRAAGADTVTLTKNEILTALNKPDEFILAVVEVDGDMVSTPRYISRPFTREPDFGVTSVTYAINDLLARGWASSLCSQDELPRRDRIYRVPCASRSIRTFG